MHKRKLGPLAVEVPVIGIGTWKMEHDDRATAISAIRRAIDLGMTHVDTAEMYGAGEVETLVGEAIAGKREELFLVSKVLPRNASYAGTIAACEASLARLRTDRLELYLLHWREQLPLGDTFRAFEALRAQGKIRAWGVSNFDEADLADALGEVGSGKIACNQVLYHLKDRTIENRVIPWCEQHDVAVVAYSPFGSGDFPRIKILDDIAKRLGATPHQVALTFLTRRPSVFAIPKSANPAHINELAGADRLELDDAAIAALEAAFPVTPSRGLSMT